jgi:phosphopantothenoylcysteine decarboxylase/phosphopantothenate--cysteine ligase
LLVNCIVTAGPTFESLDQVRRLTNFSTGRLGTELAQFLTAEGHTVVLLRGYYAVFREEAAAGSVEPFTTTDDLSQKLEALGGPAVDAVFHAAAVSDFGFGKAYVRGDKGGLTELRGGKLSTRLGPLLVELVPTRKIIDGLRGWFPRARLVGWKYEVDGAPSDLVRAAHEQMERCRTDACVMNGPAYGAGFGLVCRGSEPQHAPDRAGLFKLLSKLLEDSRHG